MNFDKKKNNLKTAYIYVCKTLSPIITYSMFRHSERAIIS